MKKMPLITLICALVLTACAAASQAAPSYVDSAPLAYGAASEAKSNSAPAAAPQSAGQEPQNTTIAQAANPAQPRVVIQNADLSIVVKDPRDKMLKIGEMAVRMGGFVVNSAMGQVYTANNVKALEGNISIRVPSKELDNALKEIESGTIDVPSENRTGEDVTDKYVDLQSQLKAKKAAADKLYEILAKTEKADETLMVFNQLTQVQSEIEVLNGQINYYNQAATLSLISVRLIAEETAMPITIAGWHPEGVAASAVQSLIDFFQGFGSFLIWLVIFILPVTAVIIFLLALLWRLLRWFWRKVFPRKTPPSVLPPTPPSPVI